MSERVKRGISLALTAAAYGALSLETFGVFELDGVWGLAIGIVGFVAGYFGIEFVEPAREDE